MLFDGIAALFYPTPQEHLNGMWKIIKKLPPSPPPRCVHVLPFLYRHRHPRPCTTYTPSRHVRVHLYLGWHPGCDETEFVMRHSALVSDFPLDRSGRLALSRVTAKWALHGCAVSPPSWACVVARTLCSTWDCWGLQPIDACRRAKFDTVHPEYISPLAIRVLTETEGVLKLFGACSLAHTVHSFMTALQNPPHQRVRSRCATSGSGSSPHTTIFCCRCTTRRSAGSRIRSGWWRRYVSRLVSGGLR
jgi:hypothetical protein